MSIYITRPVILDLIKFMQSSDENGWTRMNRGEMNGILRYIKYLEAWKSQAIETHSALEGMVVREDGSIW